MGPGTAQKEEREVERLREQERVRAGRELLQVGLWNPMFTSNPVQGFDPVQAPQVEILSHHPSY